jgi:hypothetical protein
MGYNDPNRETADWWKDTHNWPGHDGGPSTGPYAGTSYDANQGKSSSGTGSSHDNWSSGSGNKGGGGGSGGGGGGNGCFPAGTSIATPDGTCDIAQLSKGDLVLAVDIRTGQIRKRKILKIAIHGANRIWVLRFSDGSAIRTTAVHSFLVKGSWKKASQIREGDTLAVSSPHGLSDITVVASEATESVETVYNLIVDGDFNFIADGILAHSFTYLRALKVAIWSRDYRRRPTRINVGLTPSPQN